MSEEKPDTIKLYDTANIPNQEQKKYSVSYDYDKENGICNVDYFSFKAKEHYGSFLFQSSEDPQFCFSFGYHMYIRTTRSEPDHLVELGGGPDFCDFQEVTLDEAKYTLNILEQWVKEHEAYLKERDGQ